mmetsp:Transcript_110453/g.235978  ORF Transcript_110453/g.235978 Transcript_110453/m.235978 type:complete len:168 (+) Transcript_110453:30-533(+)
MAAAAAVSMALAPKAGRERQSHQPPAWKAEAHSRTRLELESIAVRTSTASRIGFASGALGSRSTPSLGISRHEHMQLVGRIGLDGDPPPRPAAHKPTTGTPTSTGPLWSFAEPPARSGPAARARARMAAASEEKRIHGPLWRLTKARPHGPQNLAGGIDASAVRWDW